LHHNLNTMPNFGARPPVVQFFVQLMALSNTFTKTLGTLLASGV
jgi:hypothetical protein